MILVLQVYLLLSSNYSPTTWHMQAYNFLQKYSSFIVFVFFSVANLAKLFMTPTQRPTTIEHCIIMIKVLIYPSNEASSTLHFWRSFLLSSGDSYIYSPEVDRTTLGSLSLSLSSSLSCCGDVSGPGRTLVLLQRSWCAILSLSLSFFVTWLTDWLTAAT